MSLNKIIVRISTVSFIVSTLLFSLIFAVFSNAYDLDFYVDEYHKYELSEYVGLDEQDYRYGISQLIQYCKGQTDSIQTSATIYGQYSETMFNQREIDHMKDVRQLAQNVETLQDICMIVSLVSAFILLIGKGKHYFDTFINTSKITYMLIVGTIVGLLIFVFANFDLFWTTFHHIFFPTNDLWLLNPATDIMIRMLPGELFNDLVLQIAWLFIDLFVIVNAIMIAIIRQKGNYLYD